MDAMLARNRERVEAHLRLLAEALGADAGGPVADVGRARGQLGVLREALGESWQLAAELRARAAWSEQAQRGARACLEGAQDALVAVGEGGVVVSWSAGAARVFGSPARDAVGQPVERWLPGARALAARPGVWPTLGSRGAELVPLEVSATAVGLGPDALTLLVAREARAATVAAPRADERRPGIPPAVLAATSEGMLLVDVAGEVLFANRPFANLLGLDPEDLEERPAADVAQFVRELGPEPPDAFERVLVALAPGQEVAPLSCVLTRPSRRSLRLASTPMRTEAGALLGDVIVVRDVTHEERVARAKEELVGNVSHELRTPLTSIRGFVDLLRAGRGGPVSAGQKEMLDVVAENVARLTRLVADLLEVDRVEHVPITLVRVELVPLLRDVLAAGRPLAERKQLDLRLEAADALEVLADPERLRQVFSNLVENALKYTPDGRVTVRASAREGRVVVEVEDTGVGIRAADQAQLFQRFFRADDPYVREAGGTGLGLSIVKTLVERQGGAITLESEPRIGTCVRVALPEAPARPRGGKSSRSLRHLQRAASGHTPRPLPRRPRALAIDPDGVRQSLYGVALMPEGVDLQSAFSLPQALALAAVRPPDLVLLGRRVPTGADEDDDAHLLEALRADPAIGPAALVLVITRDELGQALRAGADGFVLEPLELDALKAEVRRVLDVRRTGAPAAGGGAP